MMMKVILDIQYCSQEMCCGSGPEGGLSNVMDEGSDGHCHVISMFLEVGT